MSLDEPPSLPPENAFSNIRTRTKERYTYTRHTGKYRRHLIDRQTHNHRGSMLPETLAKPKI